MKRVVELGGLAEHCDFERPGTGAGEDRPDLIVTLPGNRELAVDSKVDLKAFQDAIETGGAVREDKLNEHAAAVRAHIAHLGSKQYWSQFDREPEFVVAFLPSEPFLATALQQDSNLIEFGAAQRVILATPTTFIALLKAVSYGWRHQQLADNAREVSNLGQAVYDRLRIFSGYVEDLRKNLVRTVESYNKVAGSLETKVLPGARRFQELGVARGNEIPSTEIVESIPRSLQSLEDAMLQAEPIERAEAVPAL